MITFFDASALAKRYLPEPERLDADRVAAATIPVISRLTLVELHSAIARRQRDGTVSGLEAGKATAQISADAQIIELIEVESIVVDRASNLVDKHSLRASDAVQLASCLILRERVGEVSDVYFYTYDRRLAQAAQREGLGPPPQVHR